MSLSTNLSSINTITSVVFLTIIMTIFYSCNNKDEVITNPEANTLFHDGLTREYILHVPDSYDGSTPVPLMMSFHGFGGSAISFKNTTNMSPIADSEGFILVYPQGASLNGFSHWNAGLDTPENKSDVDDFGFVEALINKLSAEYNIDQNRIYACGFSNGAFFSYSLACYHSDLIAAIGSVSGSMIDETKVNCSPVHPTAMINLHGTYDFIVPYDGGEGIEPIADVITYWTQFNNTDTVPSISSVESNGKTVERHLYSNGDNNTSVVHYKVIGGDHSWLDINYEGSNTSQLIWDFVSKYDKNGLR